MSSEVVPWSVTRCSVSIRLGGQQAHGAQVLHQLAHVAEHVVMVLAVGVGKLAGDGDFGAGAVEESPDVPGRMVQDVRLPIARCVQHELVAVRSP
jgi:hypothetical protein